MSAATSGPRASPRPAPADEAALSSVLGAILLFGLLVSTLVTVQVQYVPVWDHQREGRLMDEVAGQMSRLQSELVEQVAEPAGTPATIPLTLAPPSGFRFFTGTTTPGTLAFDPAAGSGLTLSSTRLTLLDQSGADLYVLSEDWQPIVSAPDPRGTVPEVGSIEHFRIRVANPQTLANGQSVTLTVKDDTGAYAGKLVVFNRVQGSEYSLTKQVFSSASDTVPITQVTDGWKKTATDQGYYYVDALQQELGFTAVLAAAGKPMQLVWDNDMATASAALVYTSATTGRTGTSGLVIPAYSHLTETGRIEAHRENQEFPAQRYVLEYGALLVEQPDGAAMVAPPAFSVQQLAGQLAVSWSVPELVGSPGSADGSRSAQVAIAPMGPRLSMRAFAPQLGFEIATSHADVWADYWEATLREAGLGAPGGGQYTITTPTATSVRLELFGSGPAGADDLFLQFKDATLALSLLPSG